MPGTRRESGRCPTPVLYRDGSDSVGWHRDSDYAHGGQPDIASVSLGATRRFALHDRTAGTRAAVDLASGSLLLMTGPAVARWWHCVPKTRLAVGPRVNLTFRHMVAALAHSDARTGS